MLPFNPRGGLIVLPTRLFGPRGDLIMRMALDTGATNTIIGADMLIGAGYDLSQAAPILQVTTGSKLEMVPQLSVSRIEALNIARNSLPIGVLTLPPTGGVDGVLGLDFFRGHRLLIDLRIGLVTVD